MKSITMSAAAVLTLLASSANAALVRNTCKSGVSPNVKLECYIGWNSASDALDWFLIQGVCKSTQQEIAESSIVNVWLTLGHPDNPGPHTKTARIYVGCPGGPWRWLAETRVLWINGNYWGPWVDWPDQGSNLNFVCGN